MTRTTIQLVERRGREVRLPGEDVRFLLTHARHLIEVVPAFRRDRQRLTPREFVGSIDGPTCRFAIRPKLPWPTVRMLLGLSNANHVGQSSVEPEEGLLNVLAREFSDRLRAVARVGLIAGYRDHDTTGAFLRGKLRTADQLRDAAARAFPDRFHVTESVLDLDTAWNRIPRSIAAELLASPNLSEAARIELRDAAMPLGDLSPIPNTDGDFAIAEAEPRAAHYRPLLALCRQLHDGFTAARLPGSGTGAFLIDLSQAFERRLAQGLAAAFAARRGWSVEAQARFPVGPVVLQPDVVIRRGGNPLVVLDAKWKVPGPTPEAADLHQVLAYATITGASHVGLTYPGRRFAQRVFTVPGGNLRVSLIRVQVIGTERECALSMARLGRVIRRRKG